MNILLPLTDMIFLFYPLFIVLNLFPDKSGNKIAHKIISELLLSQLGNLGADNTRTKGNNLSGSGLLLCIWESGRST
ncbi:MAG: hypothetical protein M1510_04705, partial [Nitrospirae bacterium]|nr:hypothetical protein [Nitrospirota bacterium]